MLNEGATAGRHPFDPEERTARFGEAVVRFSKKIQREPGNNRLIDQLVGCGASGFDCRSIAVIGKEHSDLGATVNRVAASRPELHMMPIDDVWPQEGFYFRSDHYNFARKGIPILFFFNGTHPDYHEVSDELAKIDAEKESRIVKLDFYLGLEIAGSPERPKWNPESYKRIVQGAN